MNVDIAGASVLIIFSFIFNTVFQITKFIAFILFIKVCIIYLNKNK